MRQIFVKIRFNFKSHRNYLTNDTFNTKYDHPLPLSIFTRFGIESTNVEHILTTSSSWNQVLIRAEISFRTVELSVFSILRLIIAHRFSIGLRSGEFPGQSRMVISFSSKNVRIFLEVWHRARSCWKIQSPSAKSLSSTGSK